MKHEKPPVIVASVAQETHLGIPIKFADEPGAIRPVAPALGEHSRSALANVGYEESELDAMARSGAIR